jgi:hypothetical protein
MGRPANLHAQMAHSPAVLSAYTSLRAGMGFSLQSQEAVQMACDPQTAFAAVIRTAFSPRVNAHGDRLAPAGQRPGTAAPTRDTRGEER